MNRLLGILFCRGWCAIWVAAFVGCAPTQFTTLMIYETPQSFVRLEVDRTLEPETGHSHPSDISSEQMAAVLRGITIQEPVTRIPFYDDLSVPRTHRAFDDQAVAFWAPLLSLALSKATKDELVTFYQSTKISGTPRREVTSGGAFVEGDKLHLILSNLRSSTHVTADLGIVDTQDDQLTPMRSIAPQRGKLLFVPESALVEEGKDGWIRVFREDRRELIVLYKTVLLNEPESPASVSEDPAEGVPLLR